MLTPIDSPGSNQTKDQYLQIKHVNESRHQPKRFFANYESLRVEENTSTGDSLRGHHGRYIFVENCVSADTQNEDPTSRVTGATTRLCTAD